jgi:hypothetical protein
MSSSAVVLKAIGLNVQPNSLSVPDGSLTQASNVIIKRDNVIESRRGYKLNGAAFGSSTDRLKQLYSYKNALLRQYANTLQYENGVDSNGDKAFSNFAGTFGEAQAGLRTKFIEQNGNFYFTSDQGIQKISAQGNTQFTSAAGYVTQAGGIKAIDLNATLKLTQGDQSGFLPQDSAVAYRVIWGTTDANSNLILGTPSQRSEVYNPLTPMMLLDFSNMLGALDNINQTGSMINDGNYVTSLLLPTSATAGELQTNVIALAAKLDVDKLYANQSGTGAPLTIASAAISGGTCTITFSGGNPSLYLSTGSRVNVIGFTAATGPTGTNPVLATSQILTGVTSTTISFATTCSGVVTLSTAKIESYEYRYIVNNGTISSGANLVGLIVDTPATDSELVVIQLTIDRIIGQLFIEPTTVIPSTLATQYIDLLDITTAATVTLNIDIPASVNSNYFFQVYRSAITQAVSTEVLSQLVPNDEMQLVYEAYPTADQITARTVSFTDVTPDAFRGANLYSNEQTGEGALQQNDVPPYALDINRFKNSVFYANTQTKYRMSVALLGVSQMILDYNGGITPKFVISDGVTSNTYSFVAGVKQVSTITAVADVANSLNGKYFTINNAYDTKQFYVWFKTSGGTASDPAIAGKTGIKVSINTGDTAAAVASKTAQTIILQLNDFVATNPTSTTIQITNASQGQSTALTAGTSGFTSPTVNTAGVGENAATKQILLSTSISPAIAVDETAKSMIRVLNQNAGEIVYAYYFSTASTAPGNMFFEGRTLTKRPFYISTNNTNTGASFNPDFSPELTLSAITAGTPTTNLVTTSTPHNLTTGNQVVLAGTQTTPVVDGLYTVTYVSSTTFRINATITVGDAVLPVGSAIYAPNAAPSQNEKKPNRIYYSKTSQPEAVPIVNYFDVGAADKEILRIFPLRDSLFVFKQDGIYRVSGEQPPFSLALFDSSCLLAAPDSLAVVNNYIYGWTQQGISTISESGTSHSLSRPIDQLLLKQATPQYTNFKTATFGVGYESDNAYLVWTIDQINDVHATICYRYSTLTGSWTTFDKSNTCGVIDPSDDLMYLGAGDTNYMESERKEFSRYDYCDRELPLSLVRAGYLGTTLKFANVAGITAGDVLVQDQYVSLYDFNMFLKHLDNDILLNDPTYFSTLQAVPGDDLRLKLLALATKLDTAVAGGFLTAIASASGTITSSTVGPNTIITTSSPHGLRTNRYVSITGTNTSPTVDGSYVVTVLSGTTFSIPATVLQAGTTGTFTTIDEAFYDVLACYNIIVGLINTNNSFGFKNYQQVIDDKIQEVIVLSVDKNLNTLTVNTALPYIVGPMTIYKAITTEVTYAPQVMGDPLGFKHLREATMMFENKAFTSATLSFATDLIPYFTDINFNGDGNGIFGNGKFGAGYFGGGSNSAPFRTYIPRNCQRCRYVVTKFKHVTAREQWAIYGITLTGKLSLSSRAYRS